jgi:tRNA threonylcarbamoyladenosine biosynthesis protein TsaE
MEITTKSAEETQKVGEKFADSFLKERKNSLIVALVGDLGSGKTTFIQGFARGLSIKQRIISPTYILMRKYDIPSTTKKKNKIREFYHVDLYRLEGDVGGEVKQLGLTDIWGKRGNVVMIEWAEKIGNKIPKSSYTINFEYESENSRKIKINKL